MKSLGVKACPTCGARASCTDSRAAGDNTRRRYNCQCGVRWTTLEMRVPDSGPGRPLVPVMPRPPVLARVADVLTSLLQEINRT